jgi:hypothetical protein
MPMTIDMTPSWGELGLLVKRLAFSAEGKALRHIWPEAAKAFASAQALAELMPGLSDEQRAIVAKTMYDELVKQGYDPRQEGGTL